MEMASAFLEPVEQTASKRQLERTNSQSMATIEFSLQWQSKTAQHHDSYVVQKFNFWRDILPPELESQLLNQPRGTEAKHSFAAGELLPTQQANNCFRIPAKQFNRHFRRQTTIEPRAGRFYPKGFIAGVKGIFSQDVNPFRVAQVEQDQLTIDLNHPLAGCDLTIQAKILDIWDGGQEHGGRCRDLTELICQRGPGMQARWQDQATDFWSDLPFARLASGIDAEFYAKPRLVNHLDQEALSQIQALYSRLIPPKARVLDLMSSWNSHLDAEQLQPAAVTGLGMNADELAQNPLLTERIVQDLNLKPELPFADASFDAVTCTVSVEYLIKPFEVFAELARVLRPGGSLIVTFSNRWFPPKVIRLWPDLHEFERLGAVLEYFLHSKQFSQLETYSLRGLARPEDDPHFAETWLSDPIYAVWGQVAR